MSQSPSASPESQDAQLLKDVHFFAGEAAPGLPPNLCALVRVPQGASNFDAANAVWSRVADMLVKADLLCADPWLLSRPRGTAGWQEQHACWELSWDVPADSKSIQAIRDAVGDPNIPLSSSLGDVAYRLRLDASHDETRARMTTLAAGIYFTHKSGVVYGLFPTQEAAQAAQTILNQDPGSAEAEYIGAGAKRSGSDAETFVLRFGDAEAARERLRQNNTTVHRGESSALAAFDKLVSGQRRLG